MESFQFHQQLKQCRKEHKKMQGKKESQKNQSRWWIWYHDTAWGIRTCLPRLHRKAQENQIWKSERSSELVKCSKQVRGDPYWVLSSSLFWQVHLQVVCPMSWCKFQRNFDPMAAATGRFPETFLECDLCLPLLIHVVGRFLDFVP